MRGRRVDADGFITAHLRGDIDPSEPGVVLEPPPSGLVRPQWSGDVWREGATEAELEPARKAAVDRVRSGLLRRIDDARAAQLGREGWLRSRRLCEAEAVLTGDGATAHLVNAEATTRGIDRKEHAREILDRWKRDAGILAVLDRLAISASEISGVNLSAATEQATQLARELETLERR